MIKDCQYIGMSHDAEQSTTEHREDRMSEEIKQLKKTLSSCGALLRAIAKNPNRYTSEEIREFLAEHGLQGSITRT